MTHHLAIHVDENDAKVMNNDRNATSYYEGKGDTVVIELVAYGPGLNMYVEGKSPVADRIATMSRFTPNFAVQPTRFAFHPRHGADAKRAPVHR